VHQQVNPLVLTNGQARDRDIEPPDVAVAVQFGEVAVVDAKHSTAKFLVSAGNGLLFIEFHNIPTGLDRSAPWPEYVAHSQGLAGKHKAPPARFDEMPAENK
jgi:hypothetical protein